MDFHNLVCELLGELGLLCARGSVKFLQSVVVTVGNVFQQGLLILVSLELVVNVDIRNAEERYCKINKNPEEAETFFVILKT